MNGLKAVALLSGRIDALQPGCGAQARANVFVTNDERRGGGRGGWIDPGLTHVGSVPSETSAGDLIQEESRHVGLREREFATRMRTQESVRIDFCRQNPGPSSCHGYKIWEGPSRHNTKPSTARLTIRPPMAYLGPVTPRQSLSGPVLDVEVFTLEEVASYLRLSRKTVSRMARSGDLPAFKAANHWRVRRVELEGWIRCRMEARGRA